MKLNKTILGIFMIIILAVMVIAGDPFRVDENLEMGTNDVYNATNVNATNFYGTLHGGITISENLNLNEYNITNVLAVKFNTTGCGEDSEAGTVCWNSDEHTLDIVSGLSNIIQVGQEQTSIAKNGDSVPLLNGQVVSLVGSSGDRGVIRRADASTLGLASRLAVVTIDSCSVNAECPVTTFGRVRDLDTSSWTANTTLYLSADGSGNLTSTAPSFPNYIVTIAAVIRSHANDGIIIVGPNIDYTDGVTLNSLGVINDIRTNAEFIGNINGSYLQNMDLSSPTNNALIGINFSDESGTTQEFISTSGGQTISGDLTVDGSINATGGIDVGGNASFAANGNFEGDMIIDGSLTVLGSQINASVENMIMNGSFFPEIDDTFDIGSTSFRWNQLRIGSGDSSFAGNVGIGITSPSSALDVVGTIESRAIILNNPTANSNTIITDSDSNKIRLFGGSVASINNGATVGVDGNLIGGNVDIATGSNSSAYIKFRAGSSDIGRWLANGNLGIGTTSPSAKLEVQTDGEAIELQSSTSTGNTSIEFRRGANSYPHAIIKSTGTSAIREETLQYYHGGGTSAPTNPSLTLSQGGTVGIGIGDTIPTKDIDYGAGGFLEIGGTSGNLQVSGTDNSAIVLDRGSATKRADIVYATATTGQWYVGLSDSSEAGDGSEFYIGTASATTTPALWLETNGNVGIGTTSPSSPLEVTGVGTNGQIAITPDAGHTAIIQGNLPLYKYEIKWQENGFMCMATNNTNSICSTPDGHMYLPPDSSAPGTCTEGSIYTDDSGAICYCYTANTWEQLNSNGSCV